LLAYTLILKIINHNAMRMNCKKVLPVWVEFLLNLQFDWEIISEVPPPPIRDVKTLIDH